MSQRFSNAVLRFLLSPHGKYSTIVKSSAPPACRLFAPRSDATSPFPFLGFASLRRPLLVLSTAKARRLLSRKNNTLPICRPRRWPHNGGPLIRNLLYRPGIRRRYK